MNWMHVMPTLRRQDCNKFKANMVCVASFRPAFKKKRKKRKSRRRRRKVKDQ